MNWLLAWAWKGRSELFRVCVGLAGGLALCFVVARLAHSLPADARDVIGGATGCIGTLMAVEPLVDSLLSRYQSVTVAVAMIAVAVAAFFALGFIHPVLLRSGCAAVSAAIPACLWGRTERAERAPVKDETKRRLALLGCILAVLGVFVVFYPS